MAHRARLGIGASRQLRHQQGPRGSGAAALRLLQAGPEPPPGLERAAPLLVPLARSAAPPEAGACSFCGSSGLLRHNRTPKPAYAAFTGFTAETTPPQASDHRRARPGKLHQRLDPALLASPRTRPARPSCAASTPGLFTPCTSPFVRRSPLPDGRPHLLRQGDRRPRKREPGRVAALHRRHPRPSGDDHFRSRERLDLARSEPVVQLRLERVRRQLQLPARRRRLRRLQLTVHRLRPRRRLAYLPGQGSGSGRKRRPDRLPHLDRRRPRRPLHHRRPRKRRPHQRPHPELRLLLHGLRRQLQLPARRRRVRRLHVAAHDPDALGRRPQVHRQGDRSRPRTPLPSRATSPSTPPPRR